jgi:hypothetical protein
MQPVLVIKHAKWLRVVTEVNNTVMNNREIDTETPVFCTEENCHNKSNLKSNKNEDKENTST